MFYLEMGQQEKPLALHNDVDCVAFTGSGEVGKKILGYSWSKVI